MTIPVQSATSFAATLARADATTGPAPTQAPTQSPAPTQAPGGVDFAGRVRELLDDANTHQVQATEAAEAYANGERNDLHGTMIAMEQADITLRLVSNVRSRLVEAYREVMRMGA